MKIQSSYNLNEVEHCIIMFIILTVISLPQITTGCLTWWAMITSDTSGTAGSLQMTNKLNWSKHLHQCNEIHSLPAFIPMWFLQTAQPWKAARADEACSPSLIYQVQSQNQRALLIMYLTLHRADPTLDLPLSLEITFAFPFLLWLIQWLLFSDRVGAVKSTCKLTTFQWFHVT